MAVGVFARCIVRKHVIVTCVCFAAVCIFRNKVHPLTDCSASVIVFKTISEVAVSTFGLKVLSEASVDYKSTAVVLL